MATCSSSWVSGTIRPGRSRWREERAEVGEHVARVVGLDLDQAGGRREHVVDEVDRHRLRTGIGGCAIIHDGRERTLPNGSGPLHIRSSNRTSRSASLGTLVRGPSMSSEPHTAHAESRLFELARDALVVAATDGRVLRANPAACTLAGVPEEELVGRRMVDLVDDADHAALTAPDRGARPRRHDPGAVPLPRRAARRQRPLGRGDGERRRRRGLASTRSSATSPAVRTSSSSGSRRSSTTPARAWP